MAADSPSQSYKESQASHDPPRNPLRSESGVSGTGIDAVAIGVTSASNGNAQVRRRRAPGSSWYSILTPERKRACGAPLCKLRKCAPNHVSQAPPASRHRDPPGAMGGSALEGSSLRAWVRSAFGDHAAPLPELTVRPLQLQIYYKQLADWSRTSLSPFSVGAFLALTALPLQPVVKTAQRARLPPANGKCKVLQEGR